jgi:TP901 family phage tail tape measure protein
MARQIVIRIVVDNQDAINAVKLQRQEQALLQQAVRFSDEQFRKSEAQTKSMQKANESLTASYTDLVASITKGYLAGRAIAFVFNTALQSVSYLVAENAKLELTLARVAAVTGNSDKEIGNLSDTIFGLSRNTNASVNEIGSAALELAKLGFAGKDLEVALAGVARLSSILGDSLETTGNLVGGVIQTFDLSADQAAQVADKLFVATGKSATNIEGFRIAFALAGNVAHDAGIQFDELASVIAALSNQGIRASTIGTGLRNFIIELSKEGSKAQLALGGSIEGMGLLGAMQKLSELKLKPGTLVELFGKPGLPVASGISHAEEAYTSFLNQVKDPGNALEDGSKKINQTLLGSITLLKNSLVELSSTAESFAGKGLVTFFTNLSTSVHNTTDAIKDMREAIELVESGAVAKYIKDNPALAQGLSYVELVRRLHNQKEADAADIRNTDEVHDLLYPKEQKAPTGVDPAAAAIKAARLKAQEEELAKLAKKLKADYQDIRDSIDFQDYMNVPLTTQEMENLSNSLLNIAINLERIGKSKDALAVFKEYEKVRSGLRETFQEDMPRMGGDEQGQTANLAPGLERAVSNLSKSHEINQYFNDIDFDQRKRDNFIEWFRRAKESSDEFSYSLEIGKQGLSDITETAGIFSDALVETFTPWKDGKGFKDFGDAFSDFASGVIKDLGRMLAKTLLLKAALVVIGWFVGSSYKQTDDNPGDGTGPDTDLANSDGGGGTLEPVAKISSASYDRIKSAPLAKSSSQSGVTIIVQGDVFNGEKLVDKVAMANEKSKSRYV